MRAKDFRKKYPKFIYQDYLYKISKNNLELFFDFQIKHYENVSRDIKFNPKIVIEGVNEPQLEKVRKQIGESAFDNFIFHIGMMEIPSYWKTTCSPEIEIRAGYLNKTQIKWWQDFMLNGMSQFFYENKINFTSPNFLKILSSKTGGGRASSCFLRKKLKEKLEEDGPPHVLVLVPMGEGKDSITTLELLKSKMPLKQIDCFVINPTKQHFKIFKIAGIYPVKYPALLRRAGSRKAGFHRVKNPIIAKRKVDPLLIELIQNGFLNGHTPITAVVSNLAVFCAMLFGYNSVAMSCEKSADQGNVKYLGKIINHQYSKTSDFEKKFKNYIKKYLSKNIDYFSFLRKFSDLQIAEMFSKYPRYFSVFLSCNEARKTYSGTRKPSGKWCCNCSKCLFVFLILYPFLKEKDLMKIFSENLFENQKLLPIMKEIIGQKKIKPLECVGTRKECLRAFYLSWKITKARLRAKLPYLLQYFEKKILPKHPELKN